ncbi:toll-like receptor 4 isoform X1 [Biomphalaria glabrata]|uniref:Toll-like receptor 4 isoform X1 n=1 Tax=Biomphalaria glabrata TaxID=6526 RepID=A0A9W2YVS2_BIOGL|nr:toll-like receptor 4 isoform X1 [Biomphalaria glabrata]XP_055866824.1 toll-like receptor 4 isoform X1 [Biomphalaria glabrata]
MEGFSLNVFLLFSFIGIVHSSLYKENIFVYACDGSPCSKSTIDVNFEVVDCSGRSLQCVSKTWFSNSTNEIRLQNNLLTVVLEDTLNDLRGLEILYLQDNALNDIKPNAFQRLYNLQYLNLENNNLVLFDLPVTIFCDLISLTELRLVQKFEDSQEVDNRNASFPDQMFGCLRNLHSLRVSVITSTLYFNAEFQNLKYLSTLYVTGTFHSIEQNSFENVQYVTSLELRNCEAINRFSDLALGAFNHLSSISFSNVPIGLQKTLHVFRPLVNTNISFINLYRVQLENRRLMSILTKDGMLTGNSTIFLQQICLNTLQLQENYIFVIFKEAFRSDKLTSCLKTLYVFENDILGDLMALYDILNLLNLKSVAFGDPQFMVWDPTASLDVFNSNTGKREISFKSPGILMEFASNKVMLKGKENSQFLKSYLQNVNTSIMDTSLAISKSITKLDFMSLFSGITLDHIYRFDGGDNVKSLNFRHNNIKNFVFPVLGLPKLQKLYYSYNDMSVLSNNFFDVYPALQTIFLDNCKLSSFFMGKNSSRVFQYLPELQQLDLSFNSLDLMAPNTFHSNPRLNQLNLSCNRFKRIPFDLALTPNLYQLDIRKNVITSLTREEMAIIENNRNKLGDFQLFLEGNILSCECEHLPFIQWLLTTTVSLDDDRNYTCINSDGGLSYTLDYVNIEGMWRKCCGQFFLDISIVLMYLLCSGYLVVLLWVKNKTLIVSSILQLFTNMKLKKLSDYKYGVFIGYSDRDYQFACSTLRRFIEEELRLTTFVRDRDLSPTMAEAEGLMEAMNSSWKIVLVANESFIAHNEWFLFTVRSAAYSVGPANPSRVIVLVEEKCISRLPTDLLASVPEDNIILVLDWHLTYNIQQALITRLK